MSAIDTVTSGSLLLAAPIAFAAGVVSFLSPCVLPLVPGYLSFVTGLSGAELLGEEATSAQATKSGATQTVGAATAEGEAVPAGATVVSTAVAASVARTKGRVVAGSLLFVLGFTAVFVSYGALFGALGSVLLQYQSIITRVLGLLVIGLGLMFLGWIPGMQREFRVHRMPTIGLWGAPMLGVLFGLGWTPCIGPTLGAVQTLAFTEASAARGALLSFVYCLGLGLPFVVVGLLFRRLLGTIGWVRKHSYLVMRIGGGMLVVIGLLLVTGLWDDITIGLRSWVGSFGTWL